MGNTSTQLSMGLGYITRYWWYEGHLIIFRSTPKVCLNVILDGNEIARQARNTVGLTNNVEYDFKLEDKLCVLSVDKHAGTITLRVNNAVVQEANEIAADYQTTMNITITDASKKKNHPAGKSFVVYKINVKIKNGDASDEIQLERRYSEFANLDARIRSAFYRNHLLNSVPALPSKATFANLKSQITYSQLEDESIEERKVGLERYMQKLVTLPRVTTNPDLRSFLSLDPPHKLLNSSQGHDAFDAFLG